MKSLFYFLIICLVFIGCDTSKTASTTSTTNKSNDIEEAIAENQDTVRIANDNLEYEIIIIEPGFNSWLLGTARPEGYYSQEFMEGRNRIYVSEWNNRVLQPQRFSPQLYEMQINYDPGVDYGYEVNYKLYNYFIYFQLTYNQRLAGFLPRI